MGTDDAWKSLSQVNEWIRFADAKAGAVMAASGVLGAFLVNDVPRLDDFKIHTTRASLLAATIVCVGVSSLLSLLVLAPRLKTGEPRSLIYFDHIAKRYSDDRNGFVENYLELTRIEADLTHQLADQLWATSQIARRKFRRVSYAIWTSAWQ